MSIISRNWIAGFLIINFTLLRYIHGECELTVGIEKYIYIGFSEDSGESICLLVGKMETS